MKEKLEELIAQYELRAKNLDTAINGPFSEFTSEWIGIRDTLIEVTQELKTVVNELVSL